MKIFSYILLILCLSFCTVINAQTEHNDITQCVNNYIEGTSYSKVELINSAFASDAKLYLDDKDGNAMIVTPKEYASWFDKPSKRGIHNGRIGKLLSVEIVGDVATASAEIFVADKGVRYVDMFLLKKIENEWKIISKTAGVETKNMTANKVLFVVSHAGYYGTSDIIAGNSFSEIIEAYDVFDKAGYTVDFVSPNGVAVPFVYANMSDPRSRSFIYNKNFIYALGHTHRPEDIDSEEYDAIYFVGGGSVMFDTPEDREMQKLAMKIYEENKGVIASVCHGTAGIVNMKTKDGKYLVDGKTVTGYPSAYENPEREYYKHLPFLITETIEGRNGNFKYGPANESYIEVDGRIVTGQNHLSASLVAQNMITIIEAKNLK